jgi:hypothetical protein
MSLAYISPKLSWAREHLHRIAEVGVGHMLYYVVSWLFDNVLYVWVVYRFGLFKGGLLMGTLATLICAVILMTYQRVRIDWVGAGSIGRLVQSEGLATWQRVLRWADHKGGWVVFGILSLVQDAFITTAYFRRGRFGPLESKDWQIFFGSAVVGNFYWTLRSGAVGAVIIEAYRILHLP